MLSDDETWYAIPVDMQQEFEIDLDSLPKSPPVCTDHGIRLPFEKLAADKFQKKWGGYGWEYGAVFELKESEK
jgi:hypothetical protein